MFIGRQKELATLEEHYQSDGFEFFVLYGRRRVGKTALINRFVEGKELIYFTGVESNAKQNLENLSAAILGPEIGGGEVGFRNFQAALEHVFRQSRDKRLIFVIDEYPYVARAVRGLNSILQALIDRYQAESKLFLILCGSSMSYMEDKVLAYKAPLYG